MNSPHSGNICRDFINGFCRFGQRCHYRHEATAIPASRVCRYFQKGGCWFGDRCRFFHIPLPLVGPAFPGRRASVPVPLPSRVGPFSGRRGSEPAVWDSNFPSSQRCTGPQSAAASLQDAGHLPENIVEERSQDHVESAHSSGIAEASVLQEKYEGPSISETQEDGATAACSETHVKTAGFLQSKNVVCGICMDKVYEKEAQRNRVFGILPNCNHPFCLECIATWRKTKNIGPDVVRACPQCRVRSPFYVPHKYWVEGREKETVIGAFKKKCGEKRCCFFDRYGCCPFRKECLYRHVPNSNRAPFPFVSDESDDDVSLADLIVLYLNVSLLGGEDVDEDLLFSLVED